MILQYMRCPAPVTGEIRAIDVTTSSASVNIGADTQMAGKGERIWRFEVDPGGGDVGIKFGAASGTADLAARTGNNRVVRIPASGFKEFTLRSGQVAHQFFDVIGSAAAVLRYYPVSHPGTMSAATP